MRRRSSRSCLVLSLGHAFCALLLTSSFGAPSSATISVDTLESVTGKGCYTYGDNETPVSARRAALAIAQEQAVTHHRVFVQSASKVKNYQLEEDLIQTVSAAMLENIQVEKEEKKAQEICVTITAKLSAVSVEELIRQRINAKEISQVASSPLVSKNESFGLRVWTNKTNGRYVEGDRLIIYVQSGRDAYLKLDYFQADGTVVHLVPNVFRGQAFIKAGQKYSFGDDAAPEQFEIRGPFGAEIIKAVLSVRPFDTAVGSGTTSDSREYLQDLKSGLRGVKVQAAEESVSLLTQSRSVEEYKKERGTSSHNVN